MKANGKVLGKPSRWLPLAGARSAGFSMMVEGCAVSIRSGLRVVVGTCLLVLGMATSAHAWILTLLSGSLTFPASALTGRTIQVVAGSVPTWRIDTTGETSGWSLSLQLSDFTSEGHVLPAAKVRFTATDGSLLALSGQPVDLTNGPRETGDSGTLDSSLKCLTANPGYGVGVYQWTASPSRFVLTVPASSYAGTYNATLTATLIAGP